MIRNGEICAFLRDLSSNGTFVNGTLVSCNQVVELKERDEVRVESTRFTFQSIGLFHRTFAEEYILLDLLKGHIGEVFACQEKSTGERFAMKKHRFSAIPTFAQRTDKSVTAKLNLMGLCHKNIMFMKEAFEDDTSSSYVTQIADKGELFGLIVRKSKLSEDETRHIFRQLFDAVKYLVSVF